MIFHYAFGHFRFLRFQSYFINLISLTDINRTAYIIHHDSLIYEKSCDLRSCGYKKFLNHFSHCIDNSYRTIWGKILKIKKCHIKIVLESGNCSWSHSTWKLVKYCVISWDSILVKIKFEQSIKTCLRNYQKLFLLITLQSRRVCKCSES